MTTTPPDTAFPASNGQPAPHRSVYRAKVRFLSGDTSCAAWHYPGTNGGCLIMAGGGGVTKEPGTDRFAERFTAAGFSVLAFDYRRLGESGGAPRQIVRVREQLADWQAAIEFARTLPEADPRKLAIWGFSLSAGHLFPVAARNPQLAAVIAQMPLADSPAAAPNAMRHSTPLAQLRLTGRGVLDAIGGGFGRTPLLVPLAAPRGQVAMLSTPDSLDGDRALNPGNKYPEWQQQIAARSVLRTAFYRPGRYAARVRSPILFVVCDQDRTTLARPALRAARRAPHAELLRVSGGHYAPFLDAHERVVDHELAFLRRHLLGPSREARSTPTESVDLPAA